MSSTRLYLGRLSSRCREYDVEKFFKNRGRIREIVIKNGFGFVEFEDIRDASDAVYDLNGKDLCGERIVLEFSRAPRDRRDRFDDRRGDRYGAPRQTAYRLIVENLSTRCSWQDLKDMMREAGDVTFADAHKLRKHEGVICFATRSGMLRALDKFNGKEINGRRMKLIDDSRRSASRSRSRSPRSSRKRSRSRSASPRKNRSRSGSRASRSRSPRSPRTPQSPEKRSRTNSRNSSHSSPAAKKARNSPSPSCRSASPVGDRRSASPTGYCRSASSPGDRHSASPNGRRHSASPNGHRRSRSVSSRDRSRSRSPTPARKNRSPSIHSMKEEK